jgi:hypothetical protein
MVVKAKKRPRSEHGVVEQSPSEAARRSVEQAISCVVYGWLGSRQGVRNFWSIHLLTSGLDRSRLEGFLVQNSRYKEQPCLAVCGK